MTILVTGGLGFIGSHTCVELIHTKHNIIIIDNLSNSTIDVLQSIKKITGETNIPFYQMDLRSPTLEDLFIKYNIDTVIHFAGLKSVNESIYDPLEYYDNNVISTINLLNIMKKHKCFKLIFSSSAAIYGTSTSPTTENSMIGYGITNPYGKTKYFIENIIDDLAKSNNDWKIISLRYFNPIGAHKSGLIGENPEGMPNNLMPYIIRVAIHNNFCKLNDSYDYLKVFGGNYHTQDGTCRRDFIHVVDLANGHICALNIIDGINGIKYFNLGCGRSISVLELIDTFAKVNGVNLPYQIVERRIGDLEDVYCDNNLAINELNWIPLFSIDDMCRDGFNFEMNKRGLKHI